MKAPGRRAGASASGATHAPHHASREWIEKYRGKFSQGWDKLREETLERQKKLGVVPRNTKLAPKPAAIKDWDTLTPEEKRLFERQMDIFAGFAEHTDYEVGRLIAALEERGELENTLLFYIVGDNGASAQGGMIGMFNENTYFDGVQETLDMQLKRIDELRSEHTYNHFAAGWAVAGDTPLTWTKQVASKKNPRKIGPQGKAQRPAGAGLCAEAKTMADESTMARAMRVNTSV